LTLVAVVVGSLLSNSCGSDALKVVGFGASKSIVMVGELPSIAALRSFDTTYCIVSKDNIAANFLLGQEMLSRTLLATDRLWVRVQVASAVTLALRTGSALLKAIRQAGVAALCRACVATTVTGHDITGVRLGSVLVVVDVLGVDLNRLRCSLISVLGRILVVLGHILNVLGALIVVLVTAFRLLLAFYTRISQTPRSVH
jgi:hypothetical protein